MELNKKQADAISAELGVVNLKAFSPITNDDIKKFIFIGAFSLVGLSLSSCGKQDVVETDIAIEQNIDKESETANYELDFLQEKKISDDVAKKMEEAIANRGEIRTPFDPNRIKEESKTIITSDTKLTEEMIAEIIEAEKTEEIPEYFEDDRLSVLIRVTLKDYTPEQFNDIICSLFPDYLNEYDGVISPGFLYNYAIITYDQAFNNLIVGYPETKNTFDVVPSFEYVLGSEPSQHFQDIIAGAKDLYSSLDYDHGNIPKRYTAFEYFLEHCNDEGLSLEERNLLLGLGNSDEREEIASEINSIYFRNLELANSAVTNSK